MGTLTITPQGQVTFRKEVLQHLGIEPGLAGKWSNVASLEELEEVASRGWAAWR